MKIFLSFISSISFLSFAASPTGDCWSLDTDASPAGGSGTLVRTEGIKSGCAGRRLSPIGGSGTPVSIERGCAGNRPFSKDLWGLRDWRERVLREQRVESSPENPASDWFAQRLRMKKLPERESFAGITAGEVDESAFQDAFRDNKLEFLSVDEDGNPFFYRFNPAHSKTEIQTHMARNKKPFWKVVFLLTLQGIEAEDDILHYVKFQSAVFEDICNHLAAMAVGDVGRWFDTKKPGCERQLQFVVKPIDSGMFLPGDIVLQWGGKRILLVSSLVPEGSVKKGSKKNLLHSYRQKSKSQSKK